MSKNFDMGEKEELAFIYSWRNKNKIISISHNTSYEKIDGGSLISCGAGEFLLNPESSDSFLLSSNFYGSDLDWYFHPFLETIERCILGELGAYEYHAYRTGGWYELCVSEDSIFRKIPYCSVVWRAEDIVGDVYPLPEVATYNVYSGYDLSVWKVSPKSQKLEIYVVNRFSDSHTFKTTRILAGSNEFRVILTTIISEKNGKISTASMIHSNIFKCDDLVDLGVLSGGFFISSEYLENLRICSENLLAGQFNREPVLSRK